MLCIFKPLKLQFEQFELINWIISVTAQRNRTKHQRLRVVRFKTRTQIAALQRFLINCGHWLGRNWPKLNIYTRLMGMSCVHRLDRDVVYYICAPKRTCRKLHSCGRTQIMASGRRRRMMMMMTLGVVYTCVGGKVYVLPYCITYVANKRARQTRFVLYIYFAIECVWCGSLCLRLLTQSQ